MTPSAPEPGADVAPIDAPVEPDVTELGVNELAQQAEISVDTLRYYQAKRLLTMPRRQGRKAVYSQTHLDELAQIKELADQGFTLAQIRTLKEQGAEVTPARPLLGALASTGSSATLTRQDLLEASGIDADSLDLGIQAGLLPRVDGTEDFDASALEIVTAAKALLDAGVPLDVFSDLAVRHGQHIERLVDAAIATYRFHVELGMDGDQQALRDNVDAIVPAVTQLVANHFQRTLVDRAKFD